MKANVIESNKAMLKQARKKPKSAAAATRRIEDWYRQFEGSAPKVQPATLVKLTAWHAAIPAKLASIERECEALRKSLAHAESVSIAETAPPVDVWGNFAKKLAQGHQATSAEKIWAQNNRNIVNYQRAAMASAKTQQSAREQAYQKAYSAEKQRLAEVRAAQSSNDSTNTSSRRDQLYADTLAGGCRQGSKTISVEYRYPNYSKSYTLERIQKAQSSSLQMKAAKEGDQYCRSIGSSGSQNTAVLVKPHEVTPDCSSKQSANDRVEWECSASYEITCNCNSKPGSGSSTR